MKVSFYHEKNTFLHRLDPRTKILSSVLFFLCPLLFNHPLYLLALLMVLFSLVYLSRSFSAVWKLKYLLLLLFFFSSIFWPLFVKGERILFHIMSCPVYRESVYYGVAMGIRLICFVIMGLIYVSTTKNEETTYGLIALGIPYPFSFAISTALRLVPTFVDAALTILEAQISRGLEITTKNPYKSLKRLLPLAVPMFVTAIRNTNMLGVALESKGFSPSSKRSFYLELRMQSKDFITVSLVILFFFLCLYIRIFLGLGVLIKGRI